MRDSKPGGVRVNVVTLRMRLLTIVVISHGGDKAGADMMIGVTAMTLTSNVVFQYKLPLGWDVL